jgi:hypothetical protein
VNPSGRIAVLAVAVVLVGLPLGVLTAARTTRPHHPPSPLAMEVRRLTTALQRKGATDVRCGWTGDVDGSPATVTCSGTMGSTSFDSLQEAVTGTVTSSR